MGQFRWALVALAVSLLPVSASGALEPLTGPSNGQPAPPFDLRTTDGKRVTLEAFRGKTLVVNVWATWCPPCREETADLIASYAALRKRNVAFLGVDTTEPAAIVRAFVAAKEVPYAQAIDDENAFSKAYDIAYFPTTLVIDSVGVLRARYIDTISLKQLTQLASAAAQGRSITLRSPLQEKVDRLLTARALTAIGRGDALAKAQNVRGAIVHAETLLNSNDTASGTDLLRTRVEEAAIRDRAITALAASAKRTRGATLLLAQLRGDAATDREKWPEALIWYRRALTLDGKNAEVLDGLGHAAGQLKQFDAAVDAYARLAALQPDAVAPLVSLGLEDAKAGQFAVAGHVFDRAIALGTRHVAAHPADAAVLRKLIWAHLYAGRTSAKGGDEKRARAEFNQVAVLALKLPAHDPRRDMYLEEAQEALVALNVATSLNRAGVSLTPWTGRDLPGSVPGTIKYRLVVTDSPAKAIDLRVKDLPRGWVASFCADHVCAPFHLKVISPDSGIKVIEFQLIADVPTARAPRVWVEANDGETVASAPTVALSH